MFLTVEETEQQFTYKGYTLWATKKKNGSAEKHNHNYYSNDIKELFGMMNTNPTIQITMRGQNMNMLKGFIQEWINMHHEKENGKVKLGIYLFFFCFLLLNVWENDCYILVDYI
jgi:hypothetical protein